MNPDRLRRMFEEDIPFNALLGIRVEQLSPGACTLRVPVHPRLTGDPSRPALHGGVMSALADAAGGLAVFSRLDPGFAVSTVDLRVDYLQPGAMDRDLLARAELVRLGNRVAVATVSLHQPGCDEAVALARGVYNVVRRAAE